MPDSNVPVCYSGPMWAMSGILYLLSLLDHVSSRLAPACLHECPAGRDQRLLQIVVIRAFLVLADPTELRACLF